MRNPTKILARSILVAAVAVFVGCNSAIDEEPNVVLEVATLQIPSVTAALDSAGGACIFTISGASATFNNKPKNHFAVESPFNDIVLQSVTVSYVWDNGFAVANTVFGLGGTVPANGTGTATFNVVNSSDLIAANQNPVPPDGGHTANLTLVFRGTTIAGEPVVATSGGSLTVDSCQ